MATKKGKPLGWRPTTPCREFNGPRSPKGYGTPALGPIRRDKTGMSRGRAQVQLHRWVVEQVDGPLPPGICVLHHCDNPACFRYDHLFTGTKADNNADMCAKGRHRPRGKAPAKPRLATPRNGWTHCVNGHPYDAANTSINPAAGYRQCGICARERAQRKAEAQRERARQLRWARGRANHG